MNDNWRGYSLLLEIHKQLLSREPNSPKSSRAFKLVYVLCPLSGKHEELLSANRVPVQRMIARQGKQAEFKHILWTCSIIGSVEMRKKTLVNDTTLEYDDKARVLPHI
uniref:Uncharacterized protein n=1 Tax=Ananas comosus var. bracteatus TaxID=296719 RepID=A0A6V7QZ87_ANACO